ncbi:MAG: SUMF1/EgtB/PvdO family nonheme iron enzyme [Verrucomicrobia bacterium]|nr:SUMF1/EgtB/PvdO family nonheme iron enzyme [Verrucomicrobiota bacterium]
MAAERSDPDATQRLDDAELGTTLAAGQRVFGRYVLENEIGRGGMGVVWRARDETLGETIALKFLPASVARDAVAVDEMKEETRKARRLRHPNIVSVFDFVQDATMVAVSMELVDGTTLAQLRLQQPAKVFSEKTLAPLIPQICSALDYAHHDAKVAHRDLKPANVLVTPDGTAKLADFGIARSLSETHTRLTGKAGTSGTLLYMSPQQLRGRHATAADDIYALGATLYELLAGKPPFFSGELVHQILHESPEPLSARRAALAPDAPLVPRTWVETIAACLAKEQHDRPPSAGEVVARLHGERERVQADRATSGRRALWLGLAAAGAVAVLAMVFWPKGESAKPNPVGPALAAGPQEAAPTTKRADGPPTQPSPEAPAGRLSGGPTTADGTATRAGPISAPLPREFTVTVDPPDAGAHLWLGPQSDLAVPAGGRAVVKDLPDGEHELIVQAPGYQPLTTRVTVKDGRGSAEAQLVAVKGAVEITARAGTVVTAVDARGRETRMGSVPATGTLNSDNLLTIGIYLFKFSHSDCVETRLENIELTLGRVAKLAPAQPGLPGELRIFSMPTGAQVTVNGQAAGATPATLRAQPSEKPLAVEVFARGYRRSAQTVTLKPKETRTLNVGTLAAESGGIALRMTNAQFPMTNVAVTVDGKPVDLGPALAAAPLRVEGLEVGARTVEIAHADYVPWQQSVTVRDQQMTAVEVNLKPKPGRLAIRAEPREIALTINGRAVQADEIKNGELAVPAGEPLALVASAKGYKSASRTLTLGANGRETWEVALEKQTFPVAGQPWENTLGMKFVAVPGVNVLFGVWDTRVQDYEKFASAMRREWTKPSFEQGSTHPAVNVSWDDAQAFCAWLTNKEQAEGRLGPGQKYRLPTDAEWSVAVGLDESRGGTPKSKDGQIRGVYPWGTQYPPPRGAGNYGSNLNADDFVNTSPVGSFAANRHGLYDMGGNVWQWCEDFYDGSSGVRVLRGASFYFGLVAGRLLSSFRNDCAADGRFDFVGFRCVVAVASSP